MQRVFEEFFAQGDREMTLSMEPQAELRPMTFDFADGACGRVGDRIEVSEGLRLRAQTALSGCVVDSTGSGSARLARRQNVGNGVAHPNC